MHETETVVMEESVANELRTLRERVDYHKYYLGEVLNNNLAEAFSRVKNDIAYVKQLQQFQQEQFLKQFAAVQKEIQKMFDAVFARLDVDERAHQKLKKQFGAIGKNTPTSHDIEKATKCDAALHEQLKLLETTHTQQYKEFDATLAVVQKSLADHRQEMQKAPPIQSVNVEAMVQPLQMEITGLQTQIQKNNQDLLKLVKDQNEKIASLKEEIDDVESAVTQKSNSAQKQDAVHLSKKEAEQLKLQVYELQQNAISRGLLDELRKEVHTFAARLPLKVSGAPVSKKEFDKHIQGLTEKVNALREELDTLEREFNMK